MYIGCIMYADDLVLISSSVCELQTMFDVCADVFTDIGIAKNRRYVWLNKRKDAALRGFMDPYLGFIHQDCAPPRDGDTEGQISRPLIRS